MGSSRKEPDAYVKLRGSKFPSVVCEAGFSENLEDLIDDARLWLLHTGGITKIVIVLCITESNTPNTVDGDEKISEDMSKMEKTPMEEQVLIQAITAETDLNSLAESLITLNTHAKLTKPSVGDLEAIIHVYQACQDEADIRETFSALVIPAPPIGSEAPTEFKLSFMDMFGENTPVGLNPNDSIIFSLAKLQEFVTESCEDTEWLRASCRAEKLLKEAGEWEETDTFAQRKRRRHSGGSSSKDGRGLEGVDRIAHRKRRRHGDVEGV